MNNKNNNKSENVSKDYNHFDEIHLNLINSMNSFEDVGPDQLEVVNEHMFEEASYRSMNTVYRSVDALNLHHASSAAFHPNSMIGNTNLSQSELPKFHTEEAEGIGKKELSVCSSDDSFLSRVDASARKQISGNSTTCAEYSIPHDEVNADRSFLPMQPFYVSPFTNFVTDKSVGHIKACIDSELSKHDGVSYEFFPKNCRWEAVYLIGSIRSKYEISLFQCSRGGFMVEGNRLSGDSFPFMEMYQSIRRKVTDDTKETSIPTFPNPEINDASPSDVEKSIDTVLSMAGSGIGEAQLGASQIFCDIFSSSHTAHQIGKLQDCLSALIKLTQVDFQYCNQHAICALAQVSSTPICQQFLSQNKELLTSILILCADGKYKLLALTFAQ